MCFCCLFFCTTRTFVVCCFVGGDQLSLLLFSQAIQNGKRKRMPYFTISQCRDNVDSIQRAPYSIHLHAAATLRKNKTHVNSNNKQPTRIFMQRNELAAATASTTSPASHTRLCQVKLFISSLAQSVRCSNEFVILNLLASSAATQDWLRKWWRKTIKRIQLKTTSGSSSSIKVREATQKIMHSNLLLLLLLSCERSDKKRK